MLIIGTGPRVTPIAPGMRKYLNGLGIRLEIQDTRNAAAQFNLLATERGVQQVAAALVHRPRALFLDARARQREKAGTAKPQVNE